MNKSTGEIVEMNEFHSTQDETLIPLTSKEAQALDGVSLEDRVKELGAERIVEKWNIPRIEQLRARLLFKAGYEFAMEMHKIAPLKEGTLPLKEEV